MEQEQEKKRYENLKSNILNVFWQDIELLKPGELVVFNPEYWKRDEVEEFNKTGDLTASIHKFGIVVEVHPPDHFKSYLLADVYWFITDRGKKSTHYIHNCYKQNGRAIENIGFKKKHASEHLRLTKRFIVRLSEIL